MRIGFAGLVELGAIGRTDFTRGPMMELRLVAVDEAAVPAGEGGMPDTPKWNVLAYEVELKSRNMALTRLGFEQILTNFQRYGQVPVVLYHADTDPSAHPDAAKAHGWLTELRIGSMIRNSTGQRVATLEGRIRWVNDETRAAVAAQELAFGSITVFMDAVDEESGQEIGQYLYSFSLTNKPALKDMPRIEAQAGKPVQNAPAVPSSQLTAPALRESLGRMDALITFAALLGFAAPDAQTAKHLLETFALDVGKLLGLGDHPRHDAILAKLTGLVNDAAKLGEVQKQLTSALAELHGIRKAEAVQTVAALQASGNIAKNDKARDAAIALFMRDRDQFVQIFGDAPPANPGARPGPNADRLLTERVSADEDGDRMEFDSGPADFSEQVADIAAELQAKNPTEYPRTYEGLRAATFEASRVVRSRMERQDARH